VYTEEDIIQYISTVNMPEQTKFAISVLVESFDKSTKNATLWIVVSDTTTKEVVLCEKFIHTPSGFNTKSYWARCFYNLFFDIQKSAYVRWESYVKEKQKGNDNTLS